MIAHGICKIFIRIRETKDQINYIFTKYFARNPQIKRFKIKSICLVIPIYNDSARFRLISQRITPNYMPRFSVALFPCFYLFFT